MLPVPMQKRQMDTGTEFPLDVALPVQAAGIRTPSITPRRPQQNGKVERSHRIDEEKFGSQQTFTPCTSASTTLEAWQHRYNHERFSMALNGQTPAEQLAMFSPTIASAPVISC